jgi:peptidoglycan/LPS O-acetylase OafA/YrhL
VKYRSDIDGLRAIAVLVVIAFHSGITLFAGGFIGVDVFFVISGYLITTLLAQEMQDQRFSFANFYKRRVARLLPALAITLFVVFWLGFLFYDNHGFNHLGKQTFYSALGLANIFFAGGDDYFASGVANQPLIHLWSLGVEEQFYVVWPLILLAVFKFKPKWLVPTTIVLLLWSLTISEIAAQAQTPASYFMPHYRAFELLIGALTALLLMRYDTRQLNNSLRTALGWLGVVLIFAPILVLDKYSVFPGLNALWPCLGTALLIAFPSESWLTRVLSAKPMVLVGLISYPLYLYHQPMIAFLHLWSAEIAPIIMFVMVSAVTGYLAWLTYRFVESPVRRMTNKGSRRTKRFAIGSLVMTIPLFAAIGVGVAKTDGLPQRFELLNPFADRLNEIHAMPFYRHYSDGWQVSEPPKGKVLFLGDSVMQQYVEPMSQALGYQVDDVETVTRGLCVMLKDVQYVDQIGSISCDLLRERAFAITTQYDYVILSQAWQGYGANVKNFTAESDDLFGRWQGLLANTVAHLREHAKHVIIIGAHPIIDGTGGIRSRVFMTAERYERALGELKLAHPERLLKGRLFFDQFAAEHGVHVVHPQDIFCREDCTFSSDKWSYFGDSVHISTAALPFVEQRFRELLAPLTQE